MRKRINRRRKARLACMLVVQYRSRGGAASVWRPAAVLDLSEAGCRLRVAEAVADGTPLLMRFDALLHDGANSATVEAPARVMWCRGQSLSGCELGLEFTGAPVGLSEILGVLDSAQAVAALASPRGAALRGRPRSRRAADSPRGAGPRRPGA